MKRKKKKKKPEIKVDISVEISRVDGIVVEVHSPTEIKDEGDFLAVFYRVCDAVVEAVNRREDFPSYRDFENAILGARVDDKSMVFYGELFDYKRFDVLVEWHFMLVIEKLFKMEMIVY
jgi:hypothetical protein